MIKAGLLGLLIVSCLILARAVVRVVWESRPRVWRLTYERTDAAGQGGVADSDGGSGVEGHAMLECGSRPVRKASGCFSATKCGPISAAPPLAEFGPLYNKPGTSASVDTDKSVQADRAPTLTCPAGIKPGLPPSESTSQGYERGGDA